MSDPTINLNKVPNDPSLKDLLDLVKKDIMLSLNAHAIGIVQSFNAENQTVTATIAYKKTFFEYDSVTKAYKPVLLDYPILIDCPAVMLGGGTSVLTFPVAQGDECIVLFNDRSIDNWFSGSSTSAVSSSRYHSLSDGIVIVGVRSLAKSVQNFDTARAVLRNNQAMVGVGPTLIKIANNTATLNQLLQNLITAIKAISVTVPGVESGLSTATGSVSGGSQSALTAVANALGGLLE